MKSLFFLFCLYFQNGPHLTEAHPNPLTSQSEWLEIYLPAQRNDLSFAIKEKHFKLPRRTKSSLCQMSKGDSLKNQFDPCVLFFPQLPALNNSGGSISFSDSLNDEFCKESWPSAEKNKGESWGLRGGIFYWEKPSLHSLKQSVFNSKTMNIWWQEDQEGTLIQIYALDDFSLIIKSESRNKKSKEQLFSAGLHWLRMSKKDYSPGIYQLQMHNLKEHLERNIIQR